MPFESSVMGADPEKAARTALTGVENPYFPDIKEWIQRFFFDESQVCRILCIVWLEVKFVLHAMHGIPVPEPDLVQTHTTKSICH